MCEPDLGSGDSRGIRHRCHGRRRRRRSQWYGCFRARRRPDSRRSEHDEASRGSRAPQAQELSTGIIQQADAQTAAYDEAQRVQAEEAERQKAEREAAEKAAAEKAAAEKAAAEKAAADKAEADRKAAQERAARSENRGAVEKVSASAADAKAIAQSMMSAGQYTCFSNIVERESGWRVNATNPSSGAYGLVQALPGTKMATAGADWKTNPATQIKWGLNYMNQRYGSPCGAWSFWQSHHWY